MNIAPPSSVEVLEDAVSHPLQIAHEIRPLLQKHPVPQNDPRTKGLLLEAHQAEGLVLVQSRLPMLVGIFNEFARDKEAIYVLAVNETPPTSTDQFALRPHVDRRWFGDGFGVVPPRWTMVVFLYFPPTGLGGEFVAFASKPLQDPAEGPRDDARRIVRSAGGMIIPPLPGRACKLDGSIPHASLGFTVEEPENWRMALVLAEFDPGGPIPRGFFP